MFVRISALCLGAAIVAALLLGGTSGGATTQTAPRFSGDSIRDFWVSQYEPGAITEVPDPAGSGQTVFKFVVDDSDQTGPGAPNPRAELISPTAIKSGDELWWSARFLLPRSFPSRVPDWLNLIQGPFGKPFAGVPPWFIKVAGRRIEWQRSGAYNWDVPWEMPLVRGRWIDILVHARFARHGFVEMWVDGRRVTFFRRSSWNPDHRRPTQRLKMMTRDDSNDDAPNSIYLQSYRKRGMFPTVTLYQGALRIGPTRASVGG